MRTSVKLETGETLVIEPGVKGVTISIRIGAIPIKTVRLDAGRTGAILSGIEHAARAAGLDSSTVPQL